MVLCWPRVLLPSLLEWPALSSPDVALEIRVAFPAGASSTHTLCLKLGFYLWCYIMRFIGRRLCLRLGIFLPVVGAYSTDVVLQA